MFLNQPGHNTFQYCYLCVFALSFYSSGLFLPDGSEVVSTLQSPPPLLMLVSNTPQTSTRSCHCCKRVVVSYKGLFEWSWMGHWENYCNFLTQWLDAVVDTYIFMLQNGSLINTGNLRCVSRRFYSFYMIVEVCCSAGGSCSKHSTVWHYVISSLQRL